jgi:hypothetical protein
MSQGASSPVSEVYRYVAIKKLLDFNFNDLWHSYAGGKFEHTELLLFSLDDSRYVWLM